MYAVQYGKYYQLILYCGLLHFKQMWVTYIYALCHSDGTFQYMRYHLWLRMIIFWNLNSTIGLTLYTDSIQGELSGVVEQTTKTIRQTTPICSASVHGCRVWVASSKDGIKYPSLSLHALVLDSNYFHLPQVDPPVVPRERLWVQGHNTNPPALAY